MRSKLFAAVVYGAVVAALVAGTASYVAFDKTVTLSVDGHERDVHTFATDVQGVLDSAGVTVDAHDDVTPDLDASVRDGSFVALRHGRPLLLTIDGSARQVWVTADSVEEALQQVGLRDSRMVVSADRSTRVPLSGLRLEVRLPQTITVEVDGDTHVVVTTALSLTDALAEAGIELGDRDEVSVPLSTTPSDGLDVEITRVTSGQTQETSAVPYPTERRGDGNLYKGQTRIAQQGANGVRVKTFSITYKNGQPAAKTLVSDTVTKQPVPKVIAVGTRPRPVYHPASDGLNWAALARCESGGNPKRVSANGRFYGLYQFLPSTWHSVGGKGLPTDASASEQTYRAQLLYKRSGAGQWPVCGKYLFS